MVPSCGIVGEETRRTLGGRKGETDTTSLGRAERMWRDRTGGDRRAYLELDFAGSGTVVGPLLLTADTGGGEMGVAGRAGVVGVTGVTGVGGMLESLRLIWLCSEGPLLRTFSELSLLLDFWAGEREIHAQI